MMLKNIQQTIEGKMKKEQVVQKDRYERFTEN